MHIKTKLISTAAFVMGSWMLAAPAYATCGVNGYWGSECGPVTPPAPTTPPTGGDSSSTATGVGVGVGVGVGHGGHGGRGGQGGVGHGGDATATGGQGGQGGVGHGGSATGGQGGVGHGGSATSGSTSTATGGSSVAGVTGSGNSSSSSTAGVSGSGNSSSTSGVAGSGNSNVNVRNSTKVKHAANTAAMIDMQGYGPANCFGDTSPSGQFGASIQTFGWGVTANSMKASNVCAMVAIAGPQAALSYLANVDPNVRRALLANGLAEKPSQRKARIAAEAKAGAPAKNARPSQTVRCPAGSAWDGKGCWAKNLKAVSR